MRICVAVDYVDMHVIIFIYVSEYLRKNEKVSETVLICSCEACRYSLLSKKIEVENLVKFTLATVKAEGNLPWPCY